MWCKLVKPDFPLCFYNFIPNSKWNRYGTTLIGQLAPLLQLAVKVLKISHLCSLPTGPSYKVLKHKRDTWKENRGLHTQLEVREGVHQQFVKKKKPKNFISLLWKHSGWYLSFGPLSASHLLSGMSLLSRYKPECCPALLNSVLPDKVCCFGGTYDWFLCWCNWNKWHHWLPISLSVPPPFLLDSISLFLSIAQSGFCLPSFVAALRGAFCSC